MTNIRNAVSVSVAKSTANAQVKQCDAYNKRLNVKHTYRPGDKVLSKNFKRADRKGGKNTTPWLGPYKITAIYDNTCQLVGPKRSMKCKQYLCNLKPFKERKIDDQEILEQNSPIQESPGLMWIENLKLTQTDKATIDKA